MTDQKKININFPPEIQGGVYANNMFVTHTKEEFIMDFIMVAPPTGKVTARVLCYSNIVLYFFIRDKMNGNALMENNFFKYGDILKLSIVKVLTLIFLLHIIKNMKI